MQEALFNHLVFAPLLSWSHKFRYEFNTSANNNSSWLFNYYSRSTIFTSSLHILKKLINSLLQIKLPNLISRNIKIIGYFFEVLWWILIASCVACSIEQLCILFEANISFSEVVHVIKLGAITAIRVFSMLVICSLIWVPLGIFISLRPLFVEKIQPLLQFLNALPANIYFPIFVMAILYFKLNPEIWLSLMMVMGAQWYVLYNVLAGGQSIPTELMEASQNFKLTGIVKWKKMLVPAIFPYYVTGIMTASGGAWNSSIVAEVITWGNKTVSATGLGAYIISNTDVSTLFRTTCYADFCIFSYSSYSTGDK